MTTELVVPSGNVPWALYAPDGSAATAYYNANSGAYTLSVTDTNANVANSNIASIAFAGTATNSINAAQFVVAPVPLTNFPLQFGPVNYTDVDGTNTLTLSRANSGSVIFNNFGVPSQSGIEYFQMPVTFGFEYENAFCHPGMHNNFQTGYAFGGMSLPDGTTLTINPEISGSKQTGRPLSVTLPTQGTINYSYLGGHTDGGGFPGWNCQDGTVNTLVRTTTDGATTYVHTPPPGIVEPILLVAGGWQIPNNTDQNLVEVWPLPVTSATGTNVPWVVGQQLTVNGLVNAAWLNGQTVTVQAIDLDCQGLCSRAINPSNIPYSNSNVTPPGAGLIVRLPYSSYFNYPYTLEAQGVVYSGNVTSTTKVTDPAGNYVVYSFFGSYETQRQYYSASGTSLRTVITCYNGNTSNCAAAAVFGPIMQTDVYTYVGSLAPSLVETKFNNIGSVTELTNYDFGGSGSNFVNRTDTTYGTWNGSSCSAISTYIQNRVCETRTINNLGQTMADARNTYDSRGNLVRIALLSYGNTYLTKSFTYNTNGTIANVTDINGTPATVASTQCNNLLPTSVSEGALSATFVWDCPTSLLISAKDLNGAQTSYRFSDPFNRLTQITDPLGNSTFLSYTPTSTTSSFTFNNGISTHTRTATVDPLGRPHLSQVQQGPGSSNYDSIETDYYVPQMKRTDILPYVGGLGATNVSGPGVSTTYDALGRPINISDSGGGYTSYAYNNNDLLVTIGPAPSGENPKQRQLEVNALGSITSVCEITTAANGGTPCGQNTPATGFRTSYSYDGLGRLLSVNQGVQSRTYAYDLLGRKTSETSPESGTVTYTYDTAGANNWPPASPGDLTQKTDANGYKTSFWYDSLHRVTDIFGTSPSGNFCRRFRYDTSQGVLGSRPAGTIINNSMGRMVEAETDTCAWPITQSSVITDEWFSYDSRGSVTDVWESTPHSGGYYHSSASYFADGAVNVLNPLNSTSLLPTFTFSLDGEGRPNTIGASGGMNPVLSTSYNAADQMTGITFGSYDSETIQYDPNTGRMTMYQSSIGATPKTVTGNPTWNANGSLKQLVITDQLNAPDTQTCNYLYDDLSRLSSANCGGVWSQTLSYDMFGNLKKNGSVSFQPNYSTTTNRMTSISGCTPTYDANGNTTYDCLHTYTWDSYGHPITVDSSQLTYDAFGRMVEKSTPGWPTNQYLYGPGGSKLATMNGQTVVKGFSGNAVYSGGTLSYFRHLDWLGSSRFGSTPDRQMQYSQAYAPFGEIYAQAGTPDNLFTGKGQDTLSGSTSALYDFPAREYEQYGRWISPDPAGLGAADLSNPQSFNLYAYVMNRPMDAVDPLGLCSEGWGALVFCGSPVDPGVSGPGFGSIPNPGNSGLGPGGPLVGYMSMQDLAAWARAMNANYYATHTCSNGTCVPNNSPFHSDPSFGAAALSPYTMGAGLAWGSVRQGSWDAIKPSPTDVDAALFGFLAYTGPIGTEARVAYEGATEARAILGFRSFSAFKRAFGNAAEGMQWHHIVEQTPGNIRRFGAEVVHNINNLVQVPSEVHVGTESISAFYSRKQAISGGIVFRKWLATQSFEAQYEWGVKIMDQFGVVTAP